MYSSMTLKSFYQLISCCLLLTLTSTTPLSQRESQASAYAPAYDQTCPDTLISPASSGVPTDEASYVSARKKVADAAFVKWLQAVNPGFASSGSLPTLALTSSGGGWRALTCGAGFISGLDSRENNGVVSGMSGLYQAITYHTGLSGGSWLLSSIMGNGWPTISWLKTNLWENGFNHDLVLPDGLSHPFQSADSLDKIHNDLKARNSAKVAHQQNGTTLTDLWGRLLAYELFPKSTDGAVGQTLSAIATSNAGSLWASNQVPFPIITAIGVNYPQTCLPSATAPQYEFTPFHFGSWDTGIAAFTPTRYLGTSMDNGKAVKGCTTNYDNLGFVLGTSSTLFNEVCHDPTTSTNSPTSSNPVVKALLDLWKAHEGDVSKLDTRSNYATYPNPFHGLSSPPANLVSSVQELTLSDGGETSQNDPLWPLLHRPSSSSSSSSTSPSITPSPSSSSSTSPSVIIVNDNSADTSTNWPSGSQLSATYARTQALGGAVAQRMPVIPSIAATSQTALRSPQFYGCHDPQHVMIIWVPNAQWLDTGVVEANQSTWKQSYSPTETDNLIANAKLTATQGDANGKDNNSKDAKDWPTCVACAAMKNFQTFTGALKETCQACLRKYCFNPPGTQPITL